MFHLNIMLLWNWRASCAYVSMTTWFTLKSENQILYGCYSKLIYF